MTSDYYDAPEYKVLTAGDDTGIETMINEWYQNGYHRDGDVSVAKSKWGPTFVQVMRKNEETKL